MKTLKAMISVALAMLIISGFLPWASSNVFYWSPLIYYFDPYCLRGLLEINWIRGYADMAIVGLVMLLMYLLGVSFGVWTMWSGVVWGESFHRSREAGVASITSAFCWIYVWLRDPRHGLGGWVVDRADLGIGVYLAIISGMIFLFSFYLDKKYQCS